MSSSPTATWRPTATRAMLERRAALLARARQFFAARGVLEVDTPIVVNAAVTDVHIDSARVQFAERPGAPHFMHTSPEYAMKRLLAAGSGDIYQICHVVRGLERGRHHNAEFTLVEWYRVGFSLDRLMDEVDALVRELLQDAARPLTSERLTYRDAFLRELQLDPFAATTQELARAARTIGFIPSGLDHGDSGPRSSDPGLDHGDERRNELLELLMGALVGPRLGTNALTFVHGYPASQAALARLDPREPRAALRFELYCKGMELANGFEELASATQQRTRFESDNTERQRLGRPQMVLDEHLLAALEHGLPECAGVALGFDRTLMLAAGSQDINDVLPFPTERA